MKIIEKTRNLKRKKKNGLRLHHKLIIISHKVGKLSLKLKPDCIVNEKFCNNKIFKQITKWHTYKKMEGFKLAQKRYLLMHMIYWSTIHYSHSPKKPIHYSLLSIHLHQHHCPSNTSMDHRLVMWLSSLLHPLPFSESALSLALPKTVTQNDKTQKLYETQENWIPKNTNCNKQ